MKMDQFWPTFGAVNLSYQLNSKRLSLSPQFCFLPVFVGFIPGNYPFFRRGAMIFCSSRLESGTPLGFLVVSIPMVFAKKTHNYGKSLFLMGKFTIKPLSVQLLLLLDQCSTFKFPIRLYHMVIYGPTKSFSQHVFCPKSSCFPMVSLDFAEFPQQFSQPFPRSKNAPLKQR